MTNNDPERQKFDREPSAPRFRGSDSPETVASLLPSRPLVRSPRGGWSDIELQMYRHPPGGVRTFGPRDHVLALHMAGKALIDDVSDGRRRQGWADAGRCSLFPASQPVRRSWKGSLEVLLIYLNPNLLRTVAQDLELDWTSIRLIPRLTVPDQMLHRLGLLFLEEAADRCLGSTLMADSLARALTVHLLRHHSNGATQVHASAPTLNSHRLKKVIDYMRAHFDEPILLPQLAQLCGLSATHLTRAFREAAGKPPHAYLIDLRLERACDLLEHTRLPVTEIALSCGFEQSQYFATLFRRKLGRTPSEWRRQSRE